MQPYARMFEFSLGYAANLKEYEQLVTNAQAMVKGAVKDQANGWLAAEQAVDLALRK